MISSLNLVTLGQIFKKVKETVKILKIEGKNIVVNEAFNSRTKSIFLFQTICSKQAWGLKLESEDWNLNSEDEAGHFNGVPTLDEAGHGTKDEQLTLDTIYNWPKTNLSSPLNQSLTNLQSSPTAAKDKHPVAITSSKVTK